MPRRAIILVPGLGHHERNLARDRLVRALEFYSSGWRIDRIDDGDGTRAGAACLRATARAGTKVREIDVYEAYWSDLVPDWSTESPWERFKRSGLLLRYWLFGGARAWRDRGEAPPRTAQMMRLAAVFLILWWCAVALLLIQAFADLSAPEFVTQTPAVQRIWDWFTGLFGKVTGSLFAAGLLLLWSRGFLEQFANIAAYVKAYLSDDPLGDDIGLRAKTRKRVLEVLDQVTGPPNAPRYEEVFVVGHSLGGAIAVDALSDFGDSLGKVVLFTWGSALGLLAQQEPLVEREIAKLYGDSSPIRGWIDVVFPKDYMGSEVPVPRAFDLNGEPGALFARRFPAAVKPKLPQGMHIWQMARIHEAYYRSSAALVMLVAPVSDLSGSQLAAPGRDRERDRETPAPLSLSR